MSVQPLAPNGGGLHIRRGTVETYYYRAYGRVLARVLAAVALATVLSRQFTIETTREVAVLCFGSPGRGDCFTRTADVADPTFGGWPSASVADQFLTVLFGLVTWPPVAVALALATAYTLHATR